VESDVARIVGLDRSGGRFERLQEGAAKIFAASAEPDMGAVAEHAASAGIELLGPPLGSE